MSLQTNEIKFVCIASKDVFTRQHFLTRSRPGKISRQNVLHICVCLSAEFSFRTCSLFAARRNNLDIAAVVKLRCTVGLLQSLPYYRRGVIISHRKLSSLPTKEKPLKALLELVLALNSGVRLTELGTISLVNSGSIC